MGSCSKEVSMPEKTVRRLIFVYDADSGIFGLAVDTVKKALLLKGCPLCVITHGIAGEKKDWKECRDSLGVPVDYMHRDEVPADMEALVAGRLPCVVAECADDHREILLDRGVLDRCRGSVDDFKGKLAYYTAARGLRLPGSATG